jgi:hypothetical protein
MGVNCDALSLILGDVLRLTDDRRGWRGLQYGQRGVKRLRVKAVNARLIGFCGACQAMSSAGASLSGRYAARQRHYRVAIFGSHLW